MRGCLKTQYFERKGYLSSAEVISGLFFYSIERDKSQGAIYKGPKSNLTSIVQAI